MYISNNILAQSWLSVPPAPGWISIKQFKWSYLPFNMTSSWTASSCSSSDSNIASMSSSIEASSSAIKSINSWWALVNDSHVWTWSIFRAAFALTCLALIWSFQKSTADICVSNAAMSRRNFSGLKISVIVVNAVAQAAIRLFNSYLSIV